LSPPPGPRLRRRVGLAGLVLYGLGTTLGAGIFALIGKVAGNAGPWTPLAFGLAAGVGALIALCYAELVRRLPKAAGEVAFVQAGFGSSQLSRAVGFAIVAAGIVSAAAILRAAAGYVGLLLPLPLLPAVVLLLVLLAGFAAWGIAQSVTLAALLSLVEIGTILLVIAAGTMHGPEQPLAEQTGHRLAGVGIGGVLAGALLAFYAFLGFEDVVTVAEEVRAPERTLPLAIGAMFVIATAPYLALACVALASMTPAQLAASEAPMADLFAAASGAGPRLVAALGALALLNGALVQIVKSARAIYGMAADGLLPAAAGRVHPATRTPLLATGLVAVAILVLALAFPVEGLAAATAFITLLLFALVCLALVRLKRSRPTAWSGLPLAVPVLAACFSLLLLGLGLAGLLTA